MLPTPCSPIFLDQCLQVICGTHIVYLKNSIWVWYGSSGQVPEPVEMGRSWCLKHMMSIGEDIGAEPYAQAESESRSMLALDIGSCSATVCRATVSITLVVKAWDLASAEQAGW